MNILLFEDREVDQLYPITTGRPAYSISCAGYRLLDWVERFDATVASVVRPHLRTIQEVNFPKLRNHLESTPQPLLVLNSRVVPCKTSFETVRGLVNEKRFGVIRSGDSVAAAVLPSTPELSFHEMGGLPDVTQILAGELKRLPTLASQLNLIEYPHDVIRYQMSCFSENLNDRLATSQYREIRDGVFVAEGVELGEYITTDSSAGPIVIDSGAKIGPYCFLRGPAYIGPKSKVIEHSAIKDYVAIGHTVKIGGEVEASVIEPYTNKQHHGFLGHSYLGSWINLGAGTCNSDLKNTYGEVKMEYRNKKVSSGMQFLGCIVGDYSKTAINTGIFTGKTVGVCSMLYGFVTTNVPSFVNYARLFGQVTEMAPDVMVAAQQRMFARRNVVQRPCDVQLLYDMYELTRHERQLAGEPLSL